MMAKSTVCLDQLGNVAMAVVSLSFNFWALQRLLWDPKIGRKFPLGQKHTYVGVTMSKDGKQKKEQIQDLMISA